jgi:hypothetical protein
MRRFAHIVLVLALSASIGLHWAFLQSAAWVNMVVTYSLDGGFTEAVQKTFDGEHPCARCKQIQKGQDTEKKNESKSVQQKIEFFHEQPERFVACLPEARQEFVIHEAIILVRPVSPAVPPPRWA